ncbi:MAG TPA: PIG-L family deacetylase [Opitutaceae bacterium]|nr:PIG-L family deacetylase [Opitutaceae bacterium]
MKFSQPRSDIFPPSAALNPREALTRATHLCVAAHQDDIEIMAHSAIAQCFGSQKQSFAGVVVTNGAGSPRSGVYAQLTDAQMQSVRREEQRAAAAIGRYGICLQLDHPSSLVKDGSRAEVRDDLRQIFEACRPECLYLHNPADKHDTHIAVFWRCLEALRSLPVERRPAKVIGCEVWRDLDWLGDDRKVPLPTDQRPHLAAALLGVFDSQIAGGKRYDLAVLGRRLAHATFHQSHAVDAANSLAWGIDLTPLVHSDDLDPADFIASLIDEFRADVRNRVDRFRTAR